MEAWNAQKLPFSKKRLPKKVVLSYVLDYVIIIVFIAAFYALDAVEPYHQHFALQNYTLQYPYAVKERVPVADLCIIAVLAPIIIIAIYTLFIDGLFSHQAPAGVPGGKSRKLAGRYRMKDRLWELNCGILGLLLSVGAAFTITGTLKNAVGKPRPDLIDRCQPKAGSMDPVPYGLSNYSICTQTDHAILKDGFRSFPSGHSSTAFGGLYYLSIYLAAKMHLLDSRGEVWKSFIILIPTLGAALVAASRIMDARHHPFDVISGSLIGILTAWGSYRQYFPPVSETWRKGRAYPIRSWGKEPVPPEPLDRTDEGVEPLRGPLKTIDEDRPLSEVLVPPGTSDSRTPSAGNVFRQQISTSQRHRQLAEHAYSNAAGTPSSVYTSDLARAPSSTYTSNLPGSNPFSVPRRRVRGDGYTSSSSEDEHGGGDDDIELQRNLPTRAPQAAPHYNTVGEGFGVDTGYHGQARAPLTGDEADLGTRAGLASPQQQRQRQHPPAPTYAGLGNGYS